MPTIQVSDMSTLRERVEHRSQSQHFDRGAATVAAMDAAA